MVFNTTFNNITVISWRSILLMEETRENHKYYSHIVEVSFIGGGNWSDPVSVNCGKMIYLICTLWVTVFHEYFYIRNISEFLWSYF
jgi:hypothetical protein